MTNIDLSKNSLLDNLELLLTMEPDLFQKNIQIPAKRLLHEDLEGSVYISGLLGITNICQNNCLYCGLRRDRKITRYRLDLKKIKKAVDSLKDLGLTRIFFIGGENRANKIADLIEIIKYAKSKDLEVNLAASVFSETEYLMMKEAGLDFYTLKFETSNNHIFTDIKPDIPFEDRMKSIRDVKSAGLKLGSGNIIGLKNQSLDDIIQDIKLMVDLDIDWAPIVPYIPAPGTPMSEDTPMGDVNLTLRIIAILRLIIPAVRITAAQPKAGSELGFSDPEGNFAALEHGANALFVELTPMAVSNNFDITKGRILPRLEGVSKLLDKAGLTMV